MTTYRIADRRRWTSVSNGLIEDGSISFRARGLLVWLLSKPDGWSIRSEAIAASSTEGRDAIRTALNELETAGYVKRQKVQDDLGHWSTVANIYESPETPFQAPAAPTPDSQALSSNNGEPITDQQSSPSLRSVDTTQHRVAREYWEWYKAEHPGLKPTIDFLPLRSVAKNLLKSGHQPDDIVDAMKTARSWTAKSLSDEIARKRALAEERTTTVAVPHAIVRAFAKAEPFFDRHRTGATKEERQHWMRLATTLRHSGYDIGETMIRLALALRADWITTWSLQNIECPRFPGELDDYADSMERAWVNRRWNVS